MLNEIVISYTIIKESQCFYYCVFARKRNREKKEFVGHNEFLKFERRGIRSSCYVILFSYLDQWREDCPKIYVYLVRVDNPRQDFFQPQSTLQLLLGESVACPYSRDKLCSCR